MEIAKGLKCSQVLLPERFSHRSQPLLATTSCYPPTLSTSLSVSRSYRKRYLLTDMANNYQFTIGWICPLPLEKEAARLVLDEEYPQEEVQYQNAFYLGGQVGNHKIVIGVQRRIGLTGAAILAEKMRAGFPNIKYFLLVGIAGGVPCYGPAGAVSEIVLGDVVVSSPRSNHGGVVQYDKGAWEGQGRLNFRGHMSSVPGDLMAAVNNFRAEGSSKTNIAEVLKQMRLKLDDERQHQYNDPGPGRNRLFQDTYKHQGTKLDDCRECCDAKYVDLRFDRGSGATRFVDKPSIHFGNIASSNQLQISAVERNRVQQEHDVICFEMEAAGVMDEYPCVVVRGICDYADSHKNKGWQNYAAATAAAYAKGLLDMIPAIDATSSAQSAAVRG
jgi:nucleoside phosphorylase